MAREVLLRGRVSVSVPSEVDVRAVRLKLGMTQNLFAARFGFPLATLRHWEYGRRKPTGASLTLLNVIARNPRAVLQSLRRPTDAQPVDELVAVWQAGASRDQELAQAALQDQMEEREGLVLERQRRRELPAMAEAFKKRFRER